MYSKKNFPKKNRHHMLSFFLVEREGERSHHRLDTDVVSPKKRQFQSRSLARSLKRNCKNVNNEPSGLSFSLSYIAVNCLFLLSSAKTSLLIANTLSNPSRPFFAFSLNLSTLMSSIALLIFCHPPHSATILASCSNTVLAWFFGSGRYTTFSCTVNRSLHVRF